VRHIEPSAFTRVGALGVEEQRVNVLIDIVEPHAAWAELGDGYRVEAHIVVYEAPSVVQVPSSAVFRRGAGWAAYRVDDGKAREIGVEIGQSTGRRVEIVKGLVPGNEVILHPSDRVSDGAEVTRR
jgi:HlyD family secretion protein